MVVKYPFSETAARGRRIRTFSSSVEDEELIWHRDDEDRHVVVLKSDGWFLQLDDELPQELTPGATYVISKHVWHRVLKKKSAQELVVEIKVFNNHP